MALFLYRTVFALLSDISHKISEYRKNIYAFFNKLFIYFVI